MNFKREPRTVQDLYYDTQDLIYQLLHIETTII